ncbi:MAG: hypothetical protein J1E79_02060 [Rikenella sp.]|nr:hypothetical protein [Rikenella sp.]
MKKLFQFACVAAIAAGFAACGNAVVTTENVDSVAVAATVVDEAACVCDSCICDPCACAQPVCDTTACDSAACAK